MKNSDTEYRLCKNDLIVSLGGAWDEFSSENGGSNLSEENVCGRSIWSFVSGDETRMWLRTAFQFTRLRMEAVDFTYRCDSPSLKRHMRMRVIPSEDWGLHIKHETVRTERRKAPVHFEFPASVSPACKRRCSVCGRVHAMSRWQEPGARLGDRFGRVQVIYTICDACESFLANLTDVTLREK